MSSASSMLVDGTWAKLKSESTHQINYCQRSIRRNSIPRLHSPIATEQRLALNGFLCCKMSAFISRTFWLHFWIVEGSGDMLSLYITTLPQQFHIVPLSIGICCFANGIIESMLERRRPLLTNHVQNTTKWLT